MDLFQHADINHDHSISLEEFAAVVKESGIEATEDELRDVFTAMDIDHSRSIDFYELNKNLRKEVKKPEKTTPQRERRHMQVRRKATPTAPAEEEKAPDPNDLKALMAQLAELADELGRLRGDKKKLRTSISAEEAARALAAKSPWAFSPSGRWRPGLWSGWADRNTPISLEHGEPPKSRSFIDMLPLGQSSLYQA